MGRRFRTGKTKITPNRGTDAYVVVWEQDGWDSLDASGVYPEYERFASIDSEDPRTAYIYQPQANDIGIVNQGSSIDANYHKGTPIHSKEGQGPVTVGGDVSFNVSGNGTAQILRTVLQVANPAVTRVGTYGADTEILGALTAVGTTSTTSFSDDLTAVDVPVPVTVTLSNSPSVSAGADDGHITIDGKDRNGNTTASTLTWTDAEITAGTLSKTTRIHYSEIDASEPANFDAGQYAISYDKPPQFAVVDGASLANVLATTTDTLETGSGSFGESGRSDTTAMPVYVKFAGSPSITTGRISGRIYVTGTDEQGESVTENIRVLPTDLTKTVRSGMYFKTITSVTSEGFAAGTYDMNAVNEAANVTFEPSTALPVFLTIEAGKTQRPSLYRNVNFTTTAINFSRTEPVRFIATTLGGRTQHGRNGKGGTSPTNRSSLLYTSDDVFSGWQAQILSRGIEFAVQSATLTINHNLEPSALLGDRFSVSPPTASDEREVILTMELLTDNENDFREIYDNNEDMDDVVVRLTNVAQGAYPHRILFEFPRMQITEDPDYTVNGFGLVGSTLSLRAIFEQGFDYEIRALTQYSNWYPVKDLS